MLSFVSGYSQYIITTVVGTGYSAGGPLGGYSGDGGPATNARISQPSGVAVDAAGSIYFSDRINCRIRKVDPTGIISTIAGTGVPSHSGDGGPATAAMINSPNDVAVDMAGNVYFDAGPNNRIRKINTAGIVTTCVGTGIVGLPTSGMPATATTIQNNNGIYVTPLGELYFCGPSGHYAAKVDAAGILTVIAGTPGVSGYSGDGGPASNALLNFPEDIFVDGGGNVYISEGGNHTIRKIDPLGIITTIAGTGGIGSCSAAASGDGGPATLALLAYPSGVAVDGSGNVYISQNVAGGCAMIRMINTSGIISTIAGIYGPVGFSGEGCNPQISQFNGPYRITASGPDNVYICDRFNQRIRWIHHNDTPSYVQGASASVTVCRDGRVGLGSALAVMDGDNRQLLTWRVLGGPSHGTVSSPCTDTANGGVKHPDSMWYSPAAGYVGLDSFSMEVKDCGDAGDTIKVYVTVQLPPSVGVLSGAGVLCVGGTGVLSSTVSGGTWSSAAGGAVSVGSSSGVVTGVSVGTAVVSYTIHGTHCSNVGTLEVTVAAVPVATTLSGADVVCVGATASYSAGVTGGVWSSSDASVLSIGGVSGVATGVGAGTAAVSYTQSNACGTAVTTKIVSVQALPDAGVLTGAERLCTGYDGLVTASVSGGVWSVGGGGSSVATVSGGVVTGVGPGLAIISYVVTNSCGTSVATKEVWVGALAAAITGDSVLCMGKEGAVRNPSSGGVWSSSDASVATVSSSGGLMSVGVGTTVISYVLGMGCYATKEVTVAAMPSAGVVAVAAHVCKGDTATLSGGASGGNWYVRDTSVLTLVGSSVIGRGVGTSDVLYVVVAGVCADTAVRGVAVHGLPEVLGISGPAVLCVGSQRRLEGAPSGGRWESSAGAVCSIDMSGGMEGLRLGTAMLTYIIGPDVHGCEGHGVHEVEVKEATHRVTGVVEAERCAGTGNGRVRLSVAPAGAYSYEWSHGGSGAEQSGLGVGSYSVQVMDSVSGCVVGISYTVTGVAELEAEVRVAADHCKGKNGSVVVAASGGNGGYVYELNGQGGPYGGASVEGLSAGVYEVVVRDVEGCAWRGEVEVVDSACGAVVVYTGLSPNGDGYNDVWYIEGLAPYPNNSVVVLDKWGDVVYRKRGYNNEWDGRSDKGLLLPDGTYYYVVELNEANRGGGASVFKGAIILKR